jgi:DHA3 family tetracycline resistance protein-like MFS transporter
MSLPETRLRPLARVGVLRPLRNRDFALLWGGHTISLVGDGIYLVAIAWQVYELSNGPAALAVVGVAWTLPMTLFMLGGGVLSDRMDRRTLMVAADALRAAAIGTVAALSLTGAVELWHLIVLVAVYGAGEALFTPASTALMPMLVPREQLVEANALEYIVRPLALRFAGPALGGALVAAVGAGTGFAIDAGTFVVSAAFVLAIRGGGSARAAGPEAAAAPETAAAPAREAARPSAVTDLREGLRFVRATPWLWATLCGSAIALLAFFGPLRVLLPLRLKEDLGLGAGTFGAILAFGGLGSVAAALAVGPLGLPRRFITWLYLGWSLGTLNVAVFAVADLPWQFMAAAFAGGALEALGNVIWGTLLGQRVPGRLLGRVSSVDWQVSVALVPLSFAITAPFAAAFGTQATLLGAGLLGAAGGMGFLFVPGVRAPEREG